MQPNYLFDYTLRLGDNSLILGHRLSEWCGHGPVLEQDIALINVALDLIGQATYFLNYAAEVEDKGQTGDELAFMRDTIHFRNCLLVEQPNEDFGYTIVRQFLFDAFHYHHFAALKNSKDATIAALAEKSLKEITYHLRHSGEWLLRLGDGTEDSHSRVQNALNDLWRYTSDMFAMNEADKVLIAIGVAPDMNMIKQQWLQTVEEIISRATLQIPTDIYMQQGSLEGKHSEYLGFLLAEMQSLSRAYPGASW